MPPRVDALEVMARRASPREAVAFAKAAGVVRTALAQHAGVGALTIVPLRGAMPVVWAVEGLRRFENGSGASYLEVPIGVQRRDLGVGAFIERSPRPEQKRAILDHLVSKWLASHPRQAPSHLRLVLLDEVQHGGTIMTATRALRSIIKSRGLHEKLTVISALDSRRGAQGEGKTAAFRELTANRLPNTTPITVPMPMFAIDVQPLLDRVELTGDGRDLSGMEQRLRTIRNAEAERLFRVLGTLARAASIRSGPEVFDDAKEELRSGRELTRHGENWIGDVIREFQRP